jgi:nucleotide-binding universal stress UspA family protein
MTAIDTARVVVGTDGSEQALAAVRAAAAEAVRRRTSLHIVHAFIWPLLNVNVGPVADDLPRAGLRHHAEDLLAEAVDEAAQAAPQLPVTTALIDGPAAPVLLDESARAALLVLGDRGLGSVSGLLIGSVAVHTAAHARCPVLVVRGADHSGGPVVVGVDGSPLSEPAVAFAAEQSAQRGAGLVAVHALVNRAPAGSPRQDPSWWLAMLAGWRLQYPDVVIRPQIVHQDPRHALVGWSKQAQLLVVGGRGRDTFKGLFLGSVSQSVLHHAACPVAIVRAGLTAPPVEPDAQPSNNLDRFLDRPRNAVSALVPGRRSADDVLETLRSTGADVSAVIVLHGPDGVRILDRDGTAHGRRARLIRFFQNWGYDDAVLNLYDEGLRKGESVLVIPSTQDDRIAYGRLLQQHRGHAIHYFGMSSAESLSGP